MVNVQGVPRIITWEADDVLELGVFQLWRRAVTILLNLQLSWEEAPVALVLLFFGKRFMNGQIKNIQRLTLSTFVFACECVDFTLKQVAAAT